MQALLYKQLRLVCHPMTPVFCLFGVMVLIPNYPYTVIFFYVMLGLFFTFLNMREQRDIYFTALLPVPKRAAVRASCVFTVLTELLSLAVLALCCPVSAALSPGKDNLVGLDANVALLAAGFLLYAVFNAVFLPAFYKTAYRVGTAFLKAMLAVTPVMLVCEALPHVPSLIWLNDTSAAGNLRQLPLLLAAALLYTAAALLSPSTAARHYEQVDL